MASDKMMITILDDGTIKIETDGISGANHMNAENFLRDIGQLAGGVVERKQKKGFVHTHSHGSITHTH